PDSGDKDFTGEVVAYECFEKWVDHLKSFNEVPMDTLCVASAKVPISKELRLVVVGGKVVSGSTYRVNGEIDLQPLDDQPDAASILDFANLVLATNPPPLPPVHVLDIACHVGLQLAPYSIME